MKRLCLAAFFALLLHGAVFLFWPQAKERPLLPAAEKLSLRMAVPQVRQPAREREEKPLPPAPEKRPRPEEPGKKEEPRSPAHPLAQPAVDRAAPEAAPAAEPGPHTQASAPGRADGPEEKRENTAVAPAAATAPAGPAAPPLPVATAARPLYASNPPPDYPRQARRLGQQGTVLLEALVSATGRVEELEIAESSGVKSLDAAALKAVREWRFEAGRENGRAKAMRVRVPVRFELH